MSQCSAPGVHEMADLPSHSLRRINEQGSWREGAVQTGASSILLSVYFHMEVLNMCVEAYR